MYLQTISNSICHNEKIYTQYTVVFLSKIFTSPLFESSFVGGRGYQRSESFLFLALRLKFNSEVVETRLFETLHPVTGIPVK